MDINSNKIFVFYHIPRCGGTYILSFLIKLMLLLQNKYYEFTNKQPSARHIIITDDTNKCIARIIGLEKIRKIPEHSKVKKVPHKKSIFEINIKDCSPELFEHMYYICINIEPRGIKIHKDILRKINSKNYDDYHHFFPFRKPLDHAISMYHYLNDPKSSHEPTYKVYGDMSLEKYLSSHFITDSWIIRQFNNLEDNEIITEEIYKKTCDMFNKFEIFDINHINTFLEKNFQSFYDDINFSKINANKSNISNKINIPLDILKNFEERTHWDFLIYEKYCK